MSNKVERKLSQRELSSQIAAKRKEDEKAFKKHADTLLDLMNSFARKFKETGDPNFMIQREDTIEQLTTLVTQYEESRRWN